MTKSPHILNLDEIKPAVVKKIVLNGVEHAYAEPDVGLFIDQTRRAQELDKKHPNGVPPDVMVELSVEMICGCFPTAPAAEIRKLTFAQLGAIRAMLELEVQPDEATVEAGNG